MSLFNILRISCRLLWRNRLRSVLTGLGMIIGVAAVIALVSIGHGAKARIAAQIASLGENLLVIFPGSSRQGALRTGLGGRATLKPEDAVAISREVPQVIGISPEVRSRTQIIADGRNWNTVILGESSDYPELRQWRVAQGAMFLPGDVQRLAKVAVVGQTVVDELFPEGTNPLGKIVRISRVPFRIIGVLASRGFTGGQDQDDVVIVPYSSHLRRISRRDYVNSILVQVADPESFDRVMQRISDLLHDRHRLGEYDPPDFVVRSQEELVDRATATVSTLTFYLGAVAGVSLLVGGIGIMNIMLVSVTERTREIGLRLAVGAHGRDVLRQFVLEAVILSFVGGALGVVLGILGSQIVAGYQGWPVEISLAAVAGALAFSAGVGIFFGYYPARRAARLDPIQALRFE